MANKVKYGLKGVYFAKATIDPATNTATYATPVAWPGAVSLSLEDNIDFWVGQSNNGYSGDFESALVPDAFRTEILGDYEDNAGVLVEDAGAKTQPFALLFQFEGDDKNVRHVLYNCTAARPNVEGSTTEEETEPQTETLEITAVAIHSAALDLDIVKGRCTEGQTPYATWNSAVCQPVART